MDNKTESMNDTDIEEFIDSLDDIDDDTSTINNTNNIQLTTNIKKYKTLKDIEEECEKKKQPFRIEPEDFDNIYDIQFKNYHDEYNKVCDNIPILKRLIKRKMYVNVQDGMLGYSNARYINKFKLEKPDIELCDIINFIHHLKTIRPVFEYSVYIDLCQDSKFYVGISHSSYLKSDVDITDDNMAKNRLEDHRNNGGTIMPTCFTHIYPVISCICSFFGDKEDEDLITILMSKCVGNNVRGGIWASPFIIPHYPNFTIDEIKYKLKNKILQKKV